MPKNVHIFVYSHPATPWWMISKPHSLAISSHNKPSPAQYRWLAVTSIRGTHRGNSKQTKKVWLLKLMEKRERVPRDVSFVKRASWLNTCWAWELPRRRLKIAHSLGKARTSHKRQDYSTSFIRLDLLKLKDVCVRAASTPTCTDVCLNQPVTIASYGSAIWRHSFRDE